jgi:hypothetical protein
VAESCARDVPARGQQEVVGSRQSEPGWRWMRHFRIWHKADAIRADGCPLLAVKRTSNGRALMSAFDPKRTCRHCRAVAIIPLIVRGMQ